MLAIKRNMNECNMNTSILCNQDCPRQGCTSRTRVIPSMLKISHVSDIVAE